MAHNWSIHVAYASRHSAYPPPMAEISVNISVGRAIDARAEPTTVLRDALRATPVECPDAPVDIVALRTTEPDVAARDVAARETPAAELETVWRFVALRPTITFCAAGCIAADRETVTDGRDVAARVILLAVLRPD